MLPTEALDAIWTPMHLERLARTYWRFLTRVTLGLIRIAYTSQERMVVLLVRPFVLLRFKAPEYEMDDKHGLVRWRIERGVLVARRGRGGDGYLEIEIERQPCDEPGMARAARDRRGGELLPDDRLHVLAPGLPLHAVLHPRARHARVPALAGPPRPGAVARRAIRGRGRVGEGNPSSVTGSLSSGRR